MGFRTAEEVGTPFLETGTGRNVTQVPLVGVTFDGQRQDISVADIVAAEGRRTPDSTVSQRHFRFAFLLVVREGLAPTPEEIDQIDTYRRMFETFYWRAASGQASAHTAFRLSLRLATFPGPGGLAGPSAS